LKKDLEEGSENHVKVKEMLLNLSLNHTVILGSLGKYCASSPDELALVNAAKFCGYEFESRDQRKNTISIKIKGQVQTYRLLQLIDFTSARKRMTCVVETPSGDILVLCKGADSIVLPLCHKSDEALKIKTQAFIDDFANDGLRTLVLAQKKLTRSEYDKWNRKYQDAILSIKGREELLEECALELEQNFDISGSTAIEDRLQDNVAESIIHIRKAGIVIWVLTGDKIETAINVGYSSGLLDNSIN
jgi:magnesium-transporting ATPase (P-type)